MKVKESLLLLAGGIALCFNVQGASLKVNDLETDREVCPNVPLANKNVCLYRDGIQVYMTINGVDNAFYYFDFDIMAFVPVPRGVLVDEPMENLVPYIVDEDGVHELIS